MRLPTPRAVGAAVATLSDLADFLKGRLTDLSGNLAPLLRAGSGAQILPTRRGDAEADAAATGAAQQVAQAFVTAAAPFAPTAYARARLLRQMHACGLLSEDEARLTSAALEAAEAPC